MYITYYNPLRRRNEALAVFSLWRLFRICAIFMKEAHRLCIRGCACPSHMGNLGKRGSERQRSLHPCSFSSISGNTVLLHDRRRGLHARTYSTDPDRTRRPQHSHSLINHWISVHSPGNGNVFFTSKLHTMFVQVYHKCAAWLFSNLTRNMLNPAEMTRFTCFRRNQSLISDLENLRSCFR